MQSVRVIIQVDEDLHENLIKPLKQEHKLNKLIVELLRAYQGDSYVNASATVSMDTRDKSSREDLLESLKGMRDNIEALRFLNEETRNLTEEGKDFLSEDLFQSDIKDSQTENEEGSLEIKDVKTEVKMLESKDYVTRAEFNSLIEGQNKILELLKSGSLFNKALANENTNNNIQETKKESKDHVVESVDTRNLIEDKDAEVIKDDINGSSLVESLLDGMDFQF